MRLMKFDWRKDGPKLALHVVALAALANVGGWGREANYGWLAGMHASGKWALRFLLLCLAMSPLNSYLGWRWAIGLRKPAGLWSFGFAALHLVLYLQGQMDWVSTLFQIGRPVQALGLLGFTILAALAATSNKWAMRRLGKAWKRLHRGVYLALGLVCVHAILAVLYSKALFEVRDEALREARLYLGVGLVLLTLRLPRLWRALPSGWVESLHGQLKAMFGRGKVRAPEFPEIVPIVPWEPIDAPEGIVQVEHREEIEQRKTSERERQPIGEW